MSANTTAKFPAAGSGKTRIAMPYYAQVSGSCWAAVAAMLAKGSAPDKQFGVYHFLMWLGRQPDAYGVNAHSESFQQDLPSIISTLTNAKAAMASATDAESLINQLIPLLDQGMPVALAWYRHIVLVVGYRWLKPSVTKPVQLELLFHDPTGNYNPRPSHNEGGIYTWRSWDWFKARTWFLDRYLHLLWLARPPHPQRPLQTIGVPTAHLPTWDTVSIRAASPYWIKFIISSTRTVRLTWLPDAADGRGYGWMAFTRNALTTPVAAIPLEATTLDLRLPVWNADPGQAAVVNLVGQIKRVDCSTPEYTWEDTLSLPAALAPYDYEKQIALQEFRQPGLREYSLNVVLEKEGRYLDGFEVEFGLEHPQISSLKPSSSAPGTIVTIGGSCFGEPRNTPLRRGTVLFGSEAARVFTWKLTEIQAEVPPAAISGPVEVQITGTSRARTPWILCSNSVPCEIGEGELWPQIRQCKVLHVYLGSTAIYTLQSSGEATAVETGGITPEGRKKPLGYLNFIPSPFMPGTGPQLQWRERQFTFEFRESVASHHVGKQYIRWLATGVLDVSGQLLEHLDLHVEVHTESQTGTAWGFQLQDIPLTSSSFRPAPLLAYELSGLDVAQHLTDAYGRYRNTQTQDFRNLSQLDWQATPHRPYVQVLFFCTFDDRLSAIRTQTQRLNK